MWQTNAQTDTTWRHRPHLYIASRGKNHDLTAFVSLIWMAFDLDLICTFKIKLEAESLLQQLWGPKNQSLWNNSCRPQSILTKFECTGQGATAFRNFWVRLDQWGKMGARMSSVQLGFFVTNIGYYFVNFISDDRFSPNLAATRECFYISEFIRWNFIATRVVTSDDRTLTSCFATAARGSFLRRHQKWK